MTSLHTSSLVLNLQPPDFLPTDDLICSDSPLTPHLSPDSPLTPHLSPDEDCQGRKGKRKRPVSRTTGRRGRKGAEEEEENEGEEEA